MIRILCAALALALLAAVGAVLIVHTKRLNTQLAEEEAG